MALLQAPVVLDGDQCVLQTMSFRNVVVDVVGGHCGNAQPLCQVDETSVAVGVSLHQVLLQLHKHIIRTEPVQVLSQLGFSLGETTLSQKAGDSTGTAASQKNQAMDTVGQIFQVQSRVLALTGDIRVRDEV